MGEVSVFLLPTLIAACQKEELFSEKERCERDFLLVGLKSYDHLKKQQKR
jgi:hypothetical protein